jgi:hypothetical protein
MQRVTATGIDGEERTGRRRTIRQIVIATIGCLAVAAVAVGASLWAGSGALTGFTVVADGSSHLTTEQLKEQDIADSGGRFEADSVGLNVPLMAMSPVNGVIEPPDYENAYWVREAGVSPDAAATGTVIVAMHSLPNGQAAPGNALMDVAGGRAAIAVGAVIHVDGVDYRVTATKVENKNLVPSDADVWSSVPGRLVVFTCLQLPDGSPSVDNIIITATLDPGATDSAPAPTPAASTPAATEPTPAPTSEPCDCGDPNCGGGTGG